MNKQPTALEKLKAEQRRVREICRLQELKLNEDFKYLHRHSGKFLLSGISSLFFSNKRHEEADTTSQGQGSLALGVLMKNFSPFLWEAAIPILLRWGLGRFGRLFKKRKRKR